MREAWQGFYNLAMSKKERDLIRDFGERFLGLPGVEAIVTNSDYEVVWVNQAAESWAGPLEKVRGKKCYKELGKVDSPHADCRMPEVLATGKPFFDLREDGESRYIICMVKIDDEHVGHVAINLDMMSGK